MKKLLFILNPRSGREKIRSRLVDILDVFSKEGYDIRIHVTQGQGDAAHFVKKHGGKADLIVCSGGDGTLNETVSGMMQLKRRPLLGYIPAGSTNDFAASLKLPKSMKRAAKAIVDGSGLPLDIGRFCDDRYFLYIAAFGAFTEVSYLTSQDKKNRLGHQAYMLESVKSLSSVRPYPMSVRWDGGHIEDDFVFGMVTNTLSVGGFKGLVNQEVSLNDGLYEVLLVRMPRTASDLSSVLSYLFLKEEPNEYVHRFKASNISFESTEDVDWVLDGEYGGARRTAVAQNLNKALTILVKKEE